MPSKPFVFPTGPPPKHLVIKDLRVGRGPELKKGDLFTIHQSAFEYSDHEQVAKEWGKNTFTWEWGVGSLVSAWEPGLRGMRVGGRRELIAPSRLVYHDGARIYLIELLEVESQG
jgi:FKBP-type peptidyl-prolyl cis-trans isomerase